MTKRSSISIIGLISILVVFGYLMVTTIPQLTGHDQRGPHPMAPARPQDIVLPRLPDNVGAIISITNDPKIGVCVGFINTEGKPEMVQYSFEYSNTGNFNPVYNKHFHFKFQER